MPAARRSHGRSPPAARALAQAEASKFQLAPIAANTALVVNWGLLAESRLVVFIHTIGQGGDKSHEKGATDLRGIVMRNIMDPVQLQPPSSKPLV